MQLKKEHLIVYMKLATAPIVNTLNFRTVLLHSFDKELGVISFVTSSRSQKNGVINNNTHVSMTAIDDTNCSGIVLSGITYPYHDAEPLPLEPVGYFCVINVKITKVEWLEFNSEPQKIESYMKVANEWISSNTAQSLM
ncbi:pyridoxamine 5'-phosphate oxidase family protein [Aeromonas finlandensis]|uniref:pyridoxamine 5'-phosphate oxidase family protein n=1 Tax=Aeromonas finlandensis TaxID=1543375 RepID=UPI0012E0A9F0|nr:pyridoxamine 5'-phosphate oxidase family protein [Aeromonas finlandensis]